LKEGAPEVAREVEHGGVASVAVFGPEHDLEREGRAPLVESRRRGLRQQERRRRRGVEVEANRVMLFIRARRLRAERAVDALLQGQRLFARAQRDCAADARRNLFGEGQRVVARPRDAPLRPARGDDDAARPDRLYAPAFEPPLAPAVRGRE
jgi:hypothetical protein